MVIACSLMTMSTVQAYTNHSITYETLDLNEQGPIKGRITDADGLGVADAEITILGTDYVTYTDPEGFFDFGIHVPDAIILVTSLEHDAVEIQVPANGRIEIQLKSPEVNQLSEVVVTALGIKREERKLGFSQQTIGSDELATAEAQNWSSGLKGKVAGLQITSASSGPINSQGIKLRGNNSLDQNKNYALIVIDGVPMSTEMTSSGNDTAYMGNDSPVDFGNALSEINQNDIESVTVLKGPAAAALYGSRAANGALIITTKSGNSKNRLGVEIKSTTSIDVVNHWPDYQYEYGQGTGKQLDAHGNPYYSYGATEDGPNTSSTSSAFGPRFDGQLFYQYDPTREGRGLERTPWIPYKNTHRGFWNTGFTHHHSVTLSGGGPQGSFRASLGHLKNTWIMPNTGYENYTASLNGNYKLSDHITVSSVVNYTRKTSDNLPSTGYNNGSIAYFMIMHSPNISLDWYKPRWKQGFDGVQMIRPFSSYIDNPYVIAYEAVNPMRSSQIVGHVKADFKLSNKFNFMLRGALNTFTQFREQKRPFDLNRSPQGSYRRQDITKMESNIDFLLNYSDRFGDFTLDANFGGNRLNYEYTSMTAIADQLSAPGIYKLTNSLTPVRSVTGDSNKKVNSLYGMVSFGWKNQIFVDITGRNDWSSTLPAGNNSFFYPSVTTSFILSDLLKIKGPFDYIKYRAAFAQVGNDTDPYRTNKYYDNSVFPSSNEVANTLYNLNLKPEMVTSWETGIEFQMFKKRLGLDFTVYQQNTDHQILRVPIDPTSGYNYRYINGGEIQNRGIEIAANLTPIKSGDFKWDMNWTWSTNENKVISLADGVEGNQQIIATAGTVSMIAVPGQSSTALYGYTFVRNEQGQIIYDPHTGLPVRPTEIEYVGDATPDWRAGLTNTFRYKHLRFSLTFDGQYGGIVYSQSYHKLMEQGKLKDSLPGREDGFIVGDGVIQHADGTYSPNTKEVDLATYYGDYYRRANVESNSFDASYLKLREISLTYDFPQKLIQKTGLSHVSLTAFGRDLWIISDFPMYDPETAALNGNSYVPGVEMGQMPSTATYGLTLKASF